MALTHVCEWSSKDKGWKRITIEDASRKYPFGVSANQEHFICEICSQYVTLTKEGVYTAYFKHSKSENDKECEERSQYYDSGYAFSPQNRNIPLRIRIEGQRVWFEIGLTRLPDDVYERNLGNKIKIVNQSGSGRVIGTYSFERLAGLGITYLPYSANIDEPYQLILAEEDKGIRAYWPKMVPGIINGMLFDCSSGKHIPSGGDVVIGKDYYLATTSMYISASEVSMKKIGIYKPNDFRTLTVYRISANRYSEGCARFFLKYGYRLSDHPVDLYPLWPVTVEKPYIIETNKDDVFFAQVGKASLQTFPQRDQQQRKFENGESSSTLVRINCNGYDQMVSVGRTRVLKYSSVRKSDFEFKERYPEVTVSKLDGTALNLSQPLPYEKNLVVTPEFYGYLKIYDGEKLKERRELTAGEGSILSGLGKASRIVIYQGKDIAAVIDFATGQKRKKEPGFIDDESMIKLLETANGTDIQIGHEIGAIAANMKSYPMAKLWLRKKIKEGKMKNGAYRMLLKHFSGK